MKFKSIFICLFIACSLALQAQDYKVIGMESLPLDMTAREHIKLDERGRQCAVLRIATQNITPDQRLGFHFESDWNSFVLERQIVEGEIWVWVSPGLKTLKVKHSQLGNIEFHTANYGITVEALHTYKIVIQGTMSPFIEEKLEVTQQYLAFQISPTDAELEVDGEIWPLSSRGTARRRVKEGKYLYKVTALGCEDEESTVIVADTAVMISVTLKPISKKPTNKPVVETKEPEKETKHPKTEQHVVERSDGSAFFVMANAAYSIAPQISFGLTVGSVKKLGWYASLGSNFNFSNSANFKCNGDGQIYNSSFGEYQFLGNQKTSRLSATAGIVFRASDPLYAYLGGGYGHRSLFWEFYNSGINYNWAKNADYSYQSFALDAGLMLHFRSFGFSVGVQTIGFNYIEAKIGIGYTLK